MPSREPILSRGNPEKIFYIVYRKDGKQIEEKAGRQIKDAVTAARAAAIRGSKIRGAKSNAQLRAEKDVDKARMTITRLWETYALYRARRKSLAPDRRRFDQHIHPAFGEKIPEEVDPLSLDRFRAKLTKTISAKTKKPLSPTTIHHIMALLRQIVNFCVLPPGRGRYGGRGGACRTPFGGRRGEGEREDQSGIGRRAIN
jgi:hypothetical protein